MEIDTHLGMVSFFFLEKKKLEKKKCLKLEKKEKKKQEGKLEKIKIKFTCKYIFGHYIP